MFAGYGIRAKDLDYDDYAGLDVKGKAVLALRYDWRGNAVVVLHNFDARAQTLMGDRSGLTLGIGDRVTVRLTEAVPVTGGLALELLAVGGKDLPRGPRPEGRSGRGPGRKPGATRPERPSRDEIAKLTTPQRIEQMRAQRAQRQSLMDKRADATNAFYAALSADQKKVFDAETVRFAGGGRHGGGHGGHGGHGMNHKS